MSERAAPYYCPFCGDENLFPHGGSDIAAPQGGARHGEWECRACRRVFAVKFIGLLGRNTNDQAGE